MSHHGDDGSWYVGHFYLHDQLMVVSLNGKLIDLSHVAEDRYSGIFKYGVCFFQPLIKEKIMSFRPRTILLICSIFLPLLFSSVKAAEVSSSVEPEADKVLRQMSDFLKAQKHFVIRAETSYESMLDSGQKLTYLNQITTYVKRPNRLYIHRTGMVRNQEIFYDGSSLTLYSRNKNMYASAKVPGTIDEMLDYATQVLNLPAPGGDLFYSHVYEGLMSDVLSGIYVGKNKVNGVLCHHLAYRGADVDWQLWVEAGDKPIPRKYIITSKWTTGAPEYSLTIYEWDSEKVIPEERFHFKAPEGALRIRFLSEKEVKDIKRKIKERQK